MDLTLGRVNYYEISLSQTMKTVFCRFHEKKINKSPKPIVTLVEKLMQKKQPSTVLHYVCQLYVCVFSSFFLDRFRFFLIAILVESVFPFFFLFSRSLSCSKACFLVFFYKFPP